MARTKQTAKRFEKALITWTRFHLPREQEWPIWSVGHNNIHIGPLNDVQGWRKASLGRMVDNPEQAAYIIEWATLDDVKNFQSSPACAEFLQNLPEHDNSQGSVESGLALKDLTLNETFLSSSPVSSRFLIFKHVTVAVTANIEGRVTFTTFLVPRKVDNVCKIWNDNFKSVFSCFTPRGYESITWHRGFRFNFSAVWLWVLSEDYWVEKKFGKLEQTQEDDQGRLIICHFHLWPRMFGATPEKEEASATDPQARESWNQAIAQVMPPATAWDQERWDIQAMPCFDPPEPEFDPEEDAEYYKEQQRLKKEFFEYHGFEVGGSSQ